MTKEQTEFYNAPVGSPLQIAIKDNEPLQKQIVEMIDACKKMVVAEERERVRGEIEGEIEKLRKPLLKNDPKYFIDGKEMRLMGESDSSKYWKDYASERYNQALDDLKPIISNLLK